MKIIFLIGLACALTGCQVARILSAGDKISMSQAPFERIDPSAQQHFLFLGDSTAVGTGSGDPATSVAGWFAKDFPKAHIENYAVNGYKLDDVIGDLDKITLPSYDFTLIQAGANDILRFTSMRDIKKNLDALIGKIEPISGHIAILHSADIGTAPMFSWPLNRIYSKRSKAVRKMYTELAFNNPKVTYIDLWALKADDIFLDDTEKFYAKDYLHLSGEGYRVWYRFIRETLKDHGADSFN